MSFDSGKLTSTLANIDVEEMSNCLANAIQKHIDYFVNSFKEGEESSLMDSPERNLLKIEE